MPMTVSLRVPDDVAMVYRHSKTTIQATLPAWMGRC